MTDEKKLSHILCPVRGAQRSEKTINRAIDLAKELDAHLSFLFVIDVEFLSHATAARINHMREELRETAAFALEFVRARAEQRGHLSVDSYVREGAMEEVIEQVAGQVGATHVVIGTPPSLTGVPGPDPKRIKAIVEKLREEGKLQVEYVE